LTFWQKTDVAGYRSGAPRKKRHKFNINTTPQGIAARTVDGITFHSEGEAKRYCVLKLLLRQGEIRDLVLQPPFDFRINGKLMFRYKADFSYVRCDTGERVIEDFKSEATADDALYKLKKKEIEESHGITITEVF
jgi:hypothetical protein